MMSHLNDLFILPSLKSCLYRRGYLDLYPWTFHVQHPLKLATRYVRMYLVMHLAFWRAGGPCVNSKMIPLIPASSAYACSIYICRAAWITYLHIYMADKFHIRTKALSLAAASELDWLDMREGGRGKRKGKRKTSHSHQRGPAIADSSAYQCMSSYIRVYVNRKLSTYVLLVLYLAINSL